MSRVLVIMGVSGVGKTTVAIALADRLGWDRGEGDDLHPAENVAKMRAGVPLTDDDRWPWLDRVAAWIEEHVNEGRPGVITCSALRRVYRDRIAGPGVTFVHLVAVADTISERMTRREDHYMPASLLTSQINTLEPLESDENGIVVSVESRAPAEIADDIIGRLALVPSTR